MASSSPTTVVDAAAVDVSLFERALRLIDYSENVAIIGSFALWEYERSSKDPTWTPGDVDIFVTGCASQECFEAFAKSYMDLAASHGVSLERADQRNKRSAIIDLSIVDTDENKQSFPTLSFIKRDDKRAADVIVSFDIDICKVVLRINKYGDRLFDISEHVKRAIQQKVLTIYRDMSSGRATWSIKARYRTAKYAARGFAIQQGKVYAPTGLAAKPFTYLSEEEEELVGHEQAVTLHAHVYENGRWSKVANANGQGVDPQLQVPHQEAHLSVITYNIWADPCGRTERVAGLVEILVTESPDVVCLQEVTRDALVILGSDQRICDLYILSDHPMLHADDKSSFTARASTGIGMANATLVRRANNNATVSFRDVVLPSQMRRRALIATLHVANNKTIVVANVHLDSNPERTDLRLEQMKVVQDAMESEMKLFDSSKAVGIVCGDFNFTPNGKEQEAISSGWTDCWDGNEKSNADAGTTIDSSTGQHWTDIWKQEAQLGYTSHHGRIDRVFLLAPESAQLEKIKLVGTGATVEVGNGSTLPLSDHDGLRADFSLQ